MSTKGSAAPVSFTYRATRPGQEGSIQEQLLCHHRLITHCQHSLQHSALLPAYDKNNKLHYLHVCPQEGVTGL